MGILDEDVVRVRDATDLVALASEHLALKRVGRTSSASARSTPRSRRRSTSTPSPEGYNCFGCDASGDAITFVREVEHLDFVDAVERLASRAGITLRYDDKNVAKDRTRKQRLSEAVAAAIDFYHDLLLVGDDGSSARGYLRSRGFDGDAARQFQLGWSPDDWDRLSLHLQQQKFARDDIDGAGLAFVNKANKLQDQFRGRLMFPIYDQRGDAVGFGGRALGDEQPEVQELARDADLPEEPVALRAQLGEGRGRRSRSGRDLRGLHRRHGVRARRCAQRGRHVRHRARRRPLPDPQEPRPQGGARLRLRRRRPERGGEVVRLGAALRDPARGRRPARRARTRPTCGATIPPRSCRRVGAAPRRSCSSASTACSRRPTSPRSKAAPAPPRPAPHRRPAPERPRARPVRDEARGRARHRRRPAARHGGASPQGTGGRRCAARAVDPAASPSRTTSRRATRRRAGARRPARARRAAVRDPRARARGRLARRAPLRRSAHAGVVRRHRIERQHPRARSRRPRIRCATCSSGSRWRSRSRRTSPRRSART